jgi:ketosteroid isomerase-like protein
MQAAPEDVRAFIQEYFDAWKGTDEAKILAYYSDDGSASRDDAVARERSTLECAASQRRQPGSGAT